MTKHVLDNLDPNVDVKRSKLEPEIWMVSDSEEEMMDKDISGEGLSKEVESVSERKGKKKEMVEGTMDSPRRLTKRAAVNPLVIKADSAWNETLKRLDRAVLDKVGSRKESAAYKANVDASAKMINAQALVLKPVLVAERAKLADLVPSTRPKQSSLAAFGFTVKKGEKENRS